jgi:hypothetical protein
MIMDNSFQRLLHFDFLVRRPTLTPDGSGGFIKVYPVGNTVLGRLDDFRDKAILEAGADLDVTSYLLYVAPGTDILKGDHVTGFGHTMNVLYLATCYEDQPLEVHVIDAKPLEEGQ